MRFRVVAALVVLGVPNATVMYAQASGSMPANHTSMVMQENGALTALLTDPLGSRGVSGTASVNGTAVRVVWSGDQPGTVRVWSVRGGPCAREEGVVGAVGAYTPITVDASGGAIGSATLGAPLAADGQFHVLVQSSAGSAAAGASATTLACGALRNAAAAARAAVSELTTSPNGSKPAAVDHSTMDHSKMDHSSMNMPGTSASGDAASSSEKMSDTISSDSSLMAIHLRMMADPVIRERVMTDPVLQRMMTGMSGMAAVAESTPEMTSVPARIGAGGSAGAASSPTTPAAKSAARSTSRAATKPAAKAVAKPAAKPAPAATPGMDHSKMPGMRKPPV